eukprot:9241062-Pyramimonas_sp.AAC.1
MSPCLDCGPSWLLQPRHDRGRHCLGSELGASVGRSLGHPEGDLEGICDACFGNLLVSVAFLWAVRGFPWATWCLRGAFWRFGGVGG